MLNVADGSVQEFLGKCRASQELVCSTIPWATAELDHSQGSRSAGSEEERLLAQLLAANQELLDALQMHEDLLRTGTEQEERERQKAERKVSASPSLRPGIDMRSHRLDTKMCSIAAAVSPSGSCPDFETYPPHASASLQQTKVL